MEKEIGKGFFGEILYLTTRNGDQKKYVTKFFERSKIDGDAESKKYLSNEILILKYLNHPNIVKFQDVKKTKKGYYLIMEYCNGGRLSKALTNYIDKNGTAFSEEIVQHLMRQIIDAFKYIHEKKIIHRNINIANILLHYDNEEDKNNFNLMKAQIKIIDFCFACKIKDNELRYSIVGTPINLDPIILKKLNSSTKKTRDLGYNESADIWSIGSVCYEMLIGKPVYDAEDMDELIEKVETGIISIPNNISHELTSFLNGMLQYYAKNRLTAEQLSRHGFLTKQVNQFKKIDLKNIELKYDSKSIKLNSHIWSIYNPDSQNLLMNISGSQFIKPVDKKEEENFKNNMKKSFVQLPQKEGIPDNPKIENISGMSKEDFEKDQIEASNDKDTHPYLFDQPIEKLFGDE